MHRRAQRHYLAESRLCLRPFSKLKHHRTQLLVHVTGVERGERETRGERVRDGVHAQLLVHVAGVD
jgi:hypothetical protein